MKTYRYTAYRQMTPWEATTAWSAKRKAMREDFETRASAAGTAFTDAWTSQSTGTAELAAQASIDRLNAEAKEKAARAKTNTPSGNNIIPSSKNSTFSTVSSTRLDGGSLIDMDAGTITMPNGAVYDLKTGLKKINVTV